MKFFRLMMVALSLSAANVIRAADDVYLFTYFTGNGEDGLHLAWSEDGYAWQALNEGRSWLSPVIGEKEKLMRDPCVARGPDGVYHMVWTSGWTESGIGYASTRDFVTWSEQRELPVMAHEPAVRNCWAPEIFYDEAAEEFVIFWASTITGTFPETAGSSESAYNHRMYATTTKDFETFTPTRLFYEPGFSVIDATLLRRAGGELAWIVKDETVNPPRKHLRWAPAESAQGPFGELGEPFTPPGVWVEGPTAVEINGEILVYFDAYTDRRYGAMRSRDGGATWDDVSARMHFPFEGTPERMRHGTVIAVPRSLVERLRDPSTRPEQLVRFTAPATHFTQAAPLGNGRLGAMPFGGVAEERIVLNEHGMWSGSPQQANRPEAAKVLPEIRRLLLAGEHAAAEQMVSEHFTAAGVGSGFGSGAEQPYGSYQLLADLRLHFADKTADTRDYARVLDVADGITTQRYTTAAGVTYAREAFVSAPDELMVMRLTASERGALSLAVSLDRPERASVSPAGPRGLRLTGRLPDGFGGENVSFAAEVQALVQGGETRQADGVLHIENAHSVILLVAGATDIKTFGGRAVDDPAAQVAADLAAVDGVSYSVLRGRHVAHHRKRFDRVALRLDAEDAVDDAARKETAARLAPHAAGANDPGLAQLYFDFGRYLLIASSRPGGLPANLQGLWADGVQTPWNGDWHLNINVQMNYWLAEVANLSDLHEPLFALIGSLTEPGAETARKYYDADGWVAHVLSNPWGFTAPGEGASWGATTTGSAWLCQHLWDHFLFTGDREFLARAYEIMKGSAEFYRDMLIEEPSHGWLVTAPANSPENGFRLPDGTVAHVCLGPTFDNQVLRYLFEATAAAATVLEVDEAEREAWRETAERLPPTRIGADGTIMEWLEDYEDADPHHRHISHLWGLYPGHEITPADTPELAEAARRTLDLRGDGGTGWALAHKAALWARLGDGERAHDLLRALLQPASQAVGITTKGGGTYANLFCAHPPFQIDGNLGGAAAIAEMLLQSEPARIVLLPALPPAWREGEVRGLKARGDIEVAMTWRAGKVDTVTLDGLTKAVTVVVDGDDRTARADADGRWTWSRE